MTLISFIIPVFEEAENISFLYNELKKHLPENFEIIFVDDGSKDNTFLEIQYLSALDQNIKCLSLSKNFGQQNALMAGLQFATGVYIFTMDGDMQHPPSLIPEMIKKLDEGFDIVTTKRLSTTGISPVKKFFTNIFYWFINFISDTKFEPNVSDFRAFNKKVLISILQFKEKELFLRGIFNWVGYKTVTINFNAPVRKYGKSKYTFSKMLRFGINGVTSFSFKPLRVAILAGSLISLAAFSFAIFALVSYFKGNTVPGWASTIIAIMFLGGTQLLAIGLLGEYIASLFIETKNRPLFLIDKKINLD